MTKNELINYLNLKSIPYAAGIYLNKDRIYIHRYCNSDEYAHNNGFTICACTFNNQGNLIEFNSGFIGSFKDVVENIVLRVDKGLKLYNCSDNPYAFKSKPTISDEIVEFISSCC